MRIARVMRNLLGEMEMSCALFVVLVVSQVNTPIKM